MADSEDPLLKTTKAMIRSVVMSVKEGVPASQLLNDYIEFTGKTVPFKELGYSSLQSFIKSIPDVVYMRMVQGVEVYFAVADQTTQHLQNLIQKQKSNPRKSSVFRKAWPMRYPKAHSQVSRTPPSSWGAGGSGWKGWSRPGSRPSGSGLKSFGQYQPSMGPGMAANTIIRQVLLPTPQTPALFNSNAVSPLVVTIRKTGEDSDREERLIERKGANGGRFIAQRALKDIMGQCQPPQDKKGGKQYELPPRFQKLQNTGKVSEGTHAAAVKPGAEDNATSQLKEVNLPKIKQWMVNILKDYHHGLWWSVFQGMLYEEFKLELVPNLIDVVQSWTDVARVELNVQAKRHVIYPQTEQTATGMAEKVVSVDERIARIAESTGTIANVGASQRKKEEREKGSRRPWKNFIVPVAQLFQEGEQVKGYASAFTSLSDFCMQRYDSCVEEITQTLLETEPEVAIPKLSDLQPGVFCSALYSLDSCWYRARILCVMSEKEISIIFIDYGNVDTVSIDNVRCLTEETAAIPAQAINCTMFGIKPFKGQHEWKEEALTMFREMTEEKILVAVNCSIENGSCVVELWSGEPELEASLNEQLFKAKLVDTYLPILDPPDLKLPETGYLEVVVAFVDLKHCWLRIVGKEFSEALEAFEDRLGTLYEAQSQPSPRLQEYSICIAHCDLLYHRVKIKEILDNKANCLFVDHGYTEWLPLDKLAPLGNEVNQMLPYQAVKCSLMGLEIYMSNPITITELVERSKNKICVAEVIVRDPLKVMLYDTHGVDDVNINAEIAGRLVAEGHVIDMGLFQPIDDSPSESSRASSPRPAPPPAPARAQHVPEIATSLPEAGPGTVTDVDQLESGTKALTLSAENTVKSNAVIGSVLNSGSGDNNPSNQLPTEGAILYRTGDVDMRGDSSSAVGGGGKSGGGVSSVAVGGVESSGGGGVISAAVNDGVKSGGDSGAVSAAGGSGVESGGGVESSDGGGVISAAVGGGVQSGCGAGTVSAAVSSGVESGSGGSLLAAGPHQDSLSVAYNYWPLPGYTALPNVDTFFAAFVQSVVDPSNFVIVPQDMMHSLEELMKNMNTHFNPDFPEGDKSAVHSATRVPEPQPNHLYMAIYNGIFYRALYLSTADYLYHVFLADYCFHMLVDKDQLFFLPKPFWALPFSAFRACLFGIKSATDLWLESTKYTFTTRALGKTLMAVIKRVEPGGESQGQEGGADSIESVQQLARKLHVHLVDTSDPDMDVVISELLFTTGSGGVISDP